MAGFSQNALETRFDGYRFRSRTEARHAVCLKAMGIAFSYEKQGYRLPNPNGVKQHPWFYLPDLYLDDFATFVEIKGIAPTETECQKCALLSDMTGLDVVLVVGDPDPKAEVLLFRPGNQRIEVITWWDLWWDHFGFPPDRIRFAVQCARGERFDGKPSNQLQLEFVGA